MFSVHTGAAPTIQNGEVVINGVTFTLADRGERLTGGFIDALVAYAPVIAVGMANSSSSIGEIAGIAASLWMLLYVLFHDAFKNGQSFGKRGAETRVICADTGQSCTLMRSVGRNLTAATWRFLWLLDVAFVFGRERRRFGDTVANTVVVRWPEAGEYSS